MGRNEQLRDSPLNRLGSPTGRGSPRRPRTVSDDVGDADSGAAPPDTAPPDTGLLDDEPLDGGSPRPVPRATSARGIGSLPAWLGAQPIPDEMLPPYPDDHAFGFDAGSRRPDGDVDDNAWDSPASDDDALDNPGRRSHRVLPAPPAALALVIVGILAVVVAAVLLVRSAPADISPISFPSTAGPTAGPTSASMAKRAAGQSDSPVPRSEVAQLVISVVGLVHKPGLVRLRPQARVADAIAAAGGARPGADLLSLNLARPLHDGDQIIVGLSGDGGRAALRSAVIGVDGSGGSPTPGAAPAPGGGSPTPAATAGKVNLNTATVAELDALPGVGPVTAAAIIDWRNRNGRFTSVDQLAEVDGIGPGRLAKLRDKVTV
ncbi:ComEA family DNA-binding protein [Gordonia asplenii]|nr:ComEA family DNA-binding protein [Gordonia asplenii]